MKKAPLLKLSNSQGECSIALLGANVCDWRPKGGEPVIFMPGKHVVPCENGTEIHGGTPVCWPWFSFNHAPEGARIHGMARYAVWDVESVEAASDRTTAVLAFDSSETTRRLWPHDFTVRLTVTLTDRLEMALAAENTGRDAFLVSEGFHPYFRVSDRANTVVRGVAGFPCINLAAEDKTPQVCKGDYPVADGSRIFKVDRYEYELADSGFGRVIHVASRGNRSLVVWNPGPAPVPCANWLEDDWRHFVCVEPCTTPAELAYELASGARHELAMSASVVKG